MMQVLALLSLTVLLSGCWDGYQMNELAIINAMAIDYTKEQYTVTAEAYNTMAVPSPGHPTSGSGSGGSNPSASIILTGSGKTLGEAMANVSASSSRHVFWATTNVVIVGRAALKEGLASITGTLLRYPQFRTTSRMFVAQGMAAPLLQSTKAGMEMTTGEVIRNQDRYLHHNISAGWAPRAYDLLRWDAQHGRSAVILAIKRRDGSDFGPQFSMTDSAVLAPTGRIQGWLPVSDAPAYLWLVHRAGQSFSTLACPTGGRTSIFWTSVTGHSRVEIAHGRVAGIHVTLAGVGKLAGPLCGNLSTISQAANHRAVVQTLATVGWAERHRADIFGWGQAIYRKNPRLWFKMDGQWPSQFQRLPVSVTAQIIIEQGDAGRV
ncbi:Ger(x)C family spore germination C-terminal domain-containing protein [Sulfobacillus harzensis]|uniref:Ger(X)C family spore germination protein n=1 Tax=Sulfobacillus harzensis TaxID=2729629 RepID=A0A7Y0Q4F4_9FIRM|nr:Ger(x)C family spore germination C-terminal domain-containing protein [Sulfobacillus harzensis]NMP23194.1 hypothetical protein [Sulfobacillus harzensis]